MTYRLVLIFVCVLSIVSVCKAEDEDQLLQRYHEVTQCAIRNIQIAGPKNCQAYARALACGNRAIAIIDSDTTGDADLLAQAREQAAEGNRKTRILAKNNGCKLR